MSKGDHQLAKHLQKQLKIIDKLLRDHVQSCSNLSHCEELHEEMTYLYQLGKAVSERMRELALFRGMIAALRQEASRMRKLNKKLAQMEINRQHFDAATIPESPLSTKKMGILRKKNLTHKQKLDFFYQQAKQQNQEEGIPTEDLKKMQIHEQYFSHLSDKSIEKGTTYDTSFFEEQMLAENSEDSADSEAKKPHDTNFVDKTSEKEYLEPPADEWQSTAEDKRRSVRKLMEQCDDISDTIVLPLEENVSKKNWDEIEEKNTFEEVAIENAVPLEDIEDVFSEFEEVAIENAVPLKDIEDVFSEDDVETAMLTPLPEDNNEELYWKNHDFSGVPTFGTEKYQEEFESKDCDLNISLDIRTQKIKINHILEEELEGIEYLSEKDVLKILQLEKLELQQLIDRHQLFEIVEDGQKMFLTDQVIRLRTHLMELETVLLEQNKIKKTMGRLKKLYRKNLE